MTSMLQRITLGALILTAALIAMNDPLFSFRMLMCIFGMLWVVYCILEDN